MTGVRNKISENLAMFVLATFVFMSLFGIGIGMEMKDGQMSSCPFMASQASICQMSVTEHINQWQLSFLGIPASGKLLAFALLLLAIVLVPSVKPFSNPPKLTPSAERLSAYQKVNSAKIFDPLLLAFSDGILNPKIYEPARI